MTAEGGSYSRSLAVARAAAARGANGCAIATEIRRRYFENDWTWRAHRAWIRRAARAISEPRAASALAGLAGGLVAVTAPTGAVPHEGGSDHDQDEQGNWHHQRDETASA
jgi:hypothetical protein